jgi:hypothetical protein
MSLQNWLTSETKPQRRQPQVSVADLAAARTHRDGPSFASKLRPHELIAMLTHHYTRVRARSLPKVKTSISVKMPDGSQAVTISLG